MGRRHFEPDQIIHMLREAEIKLAGSKTTGTTGDPSACHARSNYATISTGSHFKVGVAIRSRSTAHVERHTVAIRLLEHGLNIQGASTSWGMRSRVRRPVTYTHTPNRPPGAPLRS
jgi:hypothetical protein